jgi:hypothetical protein
VCREKDDLGAAEIPQQAEVLRKALENRRDQRQKVVIASGRIANGFGLPNHQ